MNDIAVIIREEGLLQAGQQQLDELKSHGPPVLGRRDAGIYRRSLYRSGDALYCIGRTADDKALFSFADGPHRTPFGTLEATGTDGVFGLRVEMNAANVVALWELFPFTKPVSLRERRTTIGMGDRLGVASAGHIRAARKYRCYPVLAQQSLRELDYTGRTFADVVADAGFAVFEEGYEDGFGADADHMKTIEAIDGALGEQMPMITLDLTEVLNPAAADWSADKLEEAYGALDAGLRERLENDYLDVGYDVGETTLRLDRQELQKCALLYGESLAFAERVDAHLAEKTGGAYDLEISIDETTTPTLPEHHLFIARELNVRGVTVNSLAPRFIGDFQKAVDYIGEVDEFDRQFVVHCAIADRFGGYKISVHSGSDKFAVYPSIGRHTRGRLHLKTSGTSWLEALRAVATRDPQLYRLIHRKTYDYYPQALANYHITADPSNVPAIDEVSDAELPSFLENPDWRQFLHISYGGLLSDPEVRGPFFRFLHENEETYYDLLERHFDKHITLLGIEKA
ncbi:MAG: tagaturonate epimerase family protein [Spirochaetaceae bacterium]